MDLKRILTGTLVLFLCALCTLTGKSIFSIVWHLLKLFGMQSADVSSHTIAIWDIATRIILGCIIGYIFLKQRDYRILYENKIKALRRLRDIDIKATTSQLKDLNQQNIVNNTEIKKGFREVNITLSDSDQTRIDILRDDMNEKILAEQKFLNEVLDL